MLQQGPAQQLAGQQGGQIGQQGLGVDVNPGKIKSGDFKSSDLLNRVKRGVKQPKNFR
jgi:hypothetical protein